MFSFSFHFQIQNQSFFVLKENLELNISQNPTKVISGFFYYNQQYVWSYSFLKKKEATECPEALKHQSFSS